MKNLLCFALLCISLTCYAQVSLQDYRLPDLRLEGEFRVKSIKDQGDFYVIKVERNDSIFKLISNVEKDNDTTTYCQKLKKGKRYKLKFKRRFPAFRGENPVEINGIVMPNGKAVKTEEESNYTIYRLLNANGLMLKCCDERNDSIEQAVTQLISTYPEARLQDIYKSFFQDRFGPGHLLADTVAARRYLDSEVDNNDTFGGPQYEATGWKHQFYRVNLSVVKQGLIGREVYFDAFYRSTLRVKPFSADEWRQEWNQVVAVTSRMSVRPQGFEADSLAIDSMMQAQTRPQAVHHSRAYNKAYTPHYRIIARDIFEKELLPLLVQAKRENTNPATVLP